MSDTNQMNAHEPSVIALREFKAGKYEDCLKHLNELSAHLKQNKRVIFNKAVTELYISQLKNGDAFRKQIIQMSGQLWPAANPNEIKAVTDATMFYNYAVLLYHSRYYTQAYTVLEKLFTFREQITDGCLACSIVLLLMEVCLCRRLPEKVTFFSEQSVKLFHKFPEYSDMYEQLKLRTSLMNRKQNPPPTNIQSVEWLFLRAHQQRVNGDLPGALLTLSRVPPPPAPPLPAQDSDEILAPLNNNLGILYSAMKKNYFSIKCMQEALKEHTKTIEGETKLTTSKDRHVYIFNLGVALLRANRTEGAFDCLVQAARHFPNNPRIWLRLAECCVIYYTRVNRQDIVVRKIGSGPHTKLIPGPLNKDRYATSSESYAIPTLSLEFAALCLMNAVTLLPTSEPPTDYDQFMFQAAPSSPMNYKQYCNLRNSVLLLYSFVCLRLGDPTSALYHCTSLLSRTGNPHSGQRALAHLYAAEALIGLDRISDAIHHLNPTLIHDIATEMNSKAQDTLGVAVWLNGAVCHAVRGDIASAKNILLQINSPRALPLQLYLEMSQGNVDNCRILLRKFQQVPYQL